MLDRRADFHADVLSAGVTLANPAVRQALAGISPAQIYAAVAGQAQTIAFADIAYGVAALALVLVPLVLLLQRQHVITEVGFE